MSSLPPLVALADVTVRLPAAAQGIAEPVRTTALLRDASAVARRIAKQDFSLNQTTDKIRVIGYRLRLPQKPVVSVQDVAMILPGSDTPQSFPGWYWPGDEEVWLMDEGQVINLPEQIAFLLRWQTPPCLVTYTHGYAPGSIPDDVVGVVCGMVIRTLTAPGLGGVVSETVGEYSYRLSDAAAQGTMTATPAEERILAAYRPRQKATAELRW